MVTQQFFCYIPCRFHYIVADVLQFLTMGIYTERLRYMVLQMSNLMLVGLLKLFCARCFGKDHYRLLGVTVGICQTGVKITQHEVTVRTLQVISATSYIDERVKYFIGIWPCHYIVSVDMPTISGK